MIRVDTCGESAQNLFKEEDSCNDMLMAPAKSFPIHASIA
jgi:hypothetical protein